jgi:starch phosphorylase
MNDIDHLSLHTDLSQPDDPEHIKRQIIHTLVTIVGRDPRYAQPRDWYTAIVYFLRAILGHRMADVRRRSHEQRVKRLYYLSLEYLPGRLLSKVLVDLNIKEPMREALAALNMNLDEICALEPDTALGNGGLGRLAACLMDALATHNYPGFGYGIRYEFGMFSQSIEDSQQVEHPENWLRFGDPWQYMQPSVNCTVKFNGRLNRFKTPSGEMCQWADADTVMAVAYDLPITGYETTNVLYLRLWAARASSDLDLSTFNEGNYIESVREKTLSENLSKVLYPNDATSVGQELRLRQEYFFVSASLQDILRRHLKSNPSLENLKDKVAIQLNDTHPSLAIAELMRLLVDEQGFEWDFAWAAVTEIFGYTNHTLLPEALETWPIAMLERLLPRHLDIIYRINHEHLTRVQQVFPGQLDKLGQLSLVDDDRRRIRMAHLAIVGSRRVNGVSELQSRLLRDAVFSGFKAMDMEKFISITNGVTPRQWLYAANPSLARLITQAIGAKWITDLNELEKLAPLAHDQPFQHAFRAAKLENKQRLAAFIQHKVGISVDVNSLFDVQVKRIHEYKRQLLNLLHVIHMYRNIQAGRMPRVPRTVIIGGKAAPGYVMAKRIIRLIGDVSRVINADPAAQGHLKLVFVPDYKVSAAEILIPGADLAQHISTAGTEASGTSNMKFALNGALTLGTLDGANIEIRNAVGPENIFVFGLKSAEVSELRARGYNPWAYYENDPDLKACIDMIGDGEFSPYEPERHRAIRDALLGGGDHFMLLADFKSYLAIQADIETAFLDQQRWTASGILNVAHMGYFSIDRTAMEYAEKVWGIKPFMPRDMSQLMFSGHGGTI